MSFTYDVFISYSGLDKAWAERVAEELEGRGLKTFLHTASRRPLASPLDTLEGARDMVVLWSKAAASGTVDRELARFERLRNEEPSTPRHIVPVYLEGDHTPLARYSGIDAIRESRAYDGGPTAVPPETWGAVADQLVAGLGKPRPRIFISYRRKETAGHAGRLSDALTHAFGEHQVFMDRKLAPGVDFVDAIEEVIGGCRVLLAVIGLQWATIEDEERGTRLRDPNDYVRLELRAAMERPDVTVIPVLVHGAHMPGRAELPDDVASFAHLNAHTLDDARWKHDTELLIGAIAPMVRA